MPDITEIQLIQPRGFTVGSDVHKGIIDVSFGKNAPATVPVIKEGELVPSAFHQVASERAQSEFTVTSKSYQLLTALAGTTAASASYTAKEAGTSNDYVVTLTNPVFEDGSGAVSRDRIGNYTLRGRASAVAIAAAA